MKVYLLLFLSITLSFATLSKKNLEIENPKRIYLSKTKELFTPKQDLYIGFSLDNNSFQGEKRTIRNSGKHSLYLYDRDGKVGQYLNFSIDSSPPKIVIKQKASSQFSLHVTDSSSGVKKSFYQIDNSTPVEFKQEVLIPFEQEGNYTLRVYSLDNVHNIAEKTKTIYIDNSPPQTDVEFTNASFSKDNMIIVGNKSFLTLKTNDFTKNRDTIYYKISQEVFQPYKVPINLFPLKEGNYTLSFYAQDIFGNSEPLQKRRFFFDSTPPNSQLFIDKDSLIKNGKNYVSDSSILDLHGEDIAGIQKSYLEIRKPTKKLYTPPINIKDLKNNKKRLKVYYYSIDNVGNVERKKSITLFLDNTKPLIKLTILGDFLRKDNTIFIKDKQTVQLSAKDKNSGLLKLSYKLDNNEEKPYQTPIELDTLDTHTLTAIAEDRVHNKSIKTYNFFVDSTAPSVQHYFSYQGLKAKEIGKKGSKTYYKGTTIYIRTEDKGSGMDKVFFKINQGRELEYIQPLTFKKSGVYNMTITAIDKLGNKTVQTDIIEIKESP